jgi:Transcriptional activator, adenine-specific DNA methyltransferase
VTQKYDVILADPPWDFAVWNKDSGGDRSPSAHYPTMSLPDICALPIADLASKNCALFIWAVWPRIFDAQKVIEAWGFTYRTLGFEWVKQNRTGLGFHMGMGYYTRANSEPCLLAVRGRMPVQTRSERNLMISPVRRHSQKPDEQYKKIERLYPGMAYLELFARNRRPGWDAFGNQVEGSISLKAEYA